MRLVGGAPWGEGSWHLAPHPTFNHKGWLKEGSGERWRQLKN